MFAVNFGAAYVLYSIYVAVTRGAIAIRSIRAYARQEPGTFTMLSIVLVAVALFLAGPMLVFSQVFSVGKDPLLAMAITGAQFALMVAWHQLNNDMNRWLFMSRAAAAIGLSCVLVPVLLSYAMRLGVALSAS